MKGDSRCAHQFGPWIAVDATIPVEIAVCRRCGYVAQRETQ
jgi:hypothetical protein